jgi:hypothetical protein
LVKENGLKREILVNPSIFAFYDSFSNFFKWVYFFLSFFKFLPFFLLKFPLKRGGAQKGGGEGTFSTSLLLANFKKGKKRGK